MNAYKTSQGNWQITFSDRGRSKTLYLGRDFNSASADRVARIVTDILSCRKRGDTLPREIIWRIEKLPERVRKSFERHGLIEGVAVLTLDELLEKFYETKRHLKQTTQDGYRYYGKHLIDFFGADRRIDSIGKLDAERFKNQHLGGKSVCTVSRGIRRCRSFFKFAVDADRLQSNPFKEISAGVEFNLKRQVYVDRAAMDKVMPHCRDDHDRLLLALARFGGLRTPSEINRLRYGDFDLVNNVIRIHPDTKTGARGSLVWGDSGNL